MVWTVLGRPLRGTHLDHPNCEIVPMQRGSRFFFLFAEALRCSVALILQFLMFVVVPHVGPSERVRNVMKSTSVLMIFHMKGTLGAATKCIPKITISKIRPEKQCFVRLPWELFGVHLGWSILVCATRVLQWDSKKFQKHFKTNGLGRFWGTLLGRPIRTM